MGNTYELATTINKSNKIRNRNFLPSLLLFFIFFLPFLGHSQSASTSVYWSSGWCTICGGSSYSCGPPWSGSGNWSNGVRCFSDPIPSGNVITSTCVTIYKVDCGSASVCASINGVTIQCLPTIGDCWCGNCWPQTYCISGALPGYNYGGTNCLQITYSNGWEEETICVSSADISFTYAPNCVQSGAPSFASASPSTTCGGGTTLSVGGGSLGTGANWQWYAGGCGGSYVGSGSSINVAPSSTTTYFVRAEGNCNTTSCAQVTVNVNSSSSGPSAATASPNPVCGGGSTVLSVIGGSLGTGASWQWYSGSCGGAYVGSGSSISVSPNTTTAYFVRAEGACNTTGCASVTVIAGAQSSAPSSISATPNPTCGGNVTLTQNGGSLGIGASYYWYSGACGGTFIGTGNSITVSPSSTTTYYVLASGTCNTTGCAQTTVTVNSAPTAFASPSTQSICSGNTTSISLSSNIPGTSFNWTVSQSGVSGASPSSGSSINQSLSATSNNTGIAVYTITPSAGGCSGSPISVTVVVNPIPNATASPSTQAICSGGTTSISLSSNVSTTNYNWTVSQSGVSGGANGSGSTISQTLVALGNSPGTAVYTITPSTVSCTGSPITATVTVNPLPVATAVPSNQTICSGDATSISLSSNVSGTSFNWTTNQVGVTGASNGNGASISQTLTATGTTPGTVTYNVTPSVGSCVGSTIPVTITVNPKPVATATPSSQSVCTGNSTSISLSSSLSGTTYAWTISQTGASGASNGNGSSIVQSLTTTGNSSGTVVYTVTPTVNSTGCIGNPITVPVTVNPIPTVTAVPPAQTVCSGSPTSIALNSNVVGTSFAWTISQNNVTGGSPGSASTIAQTLVNTGSTAGTASYVITPSASGCVGSPIVVNVQVDRVPVATATPSSQTICSGDVTAITLAADIPGSSFAWTVNQNGVTGAANGAGTSITQIITTAGITAGTATYTIIPTSGNCPGQPVILVVTVNPKPAVIATPPAQSVCSGSATNIALTSNITGTSFAWTANQTGVTGANTGTGTSITDVLTLTGSTTGTVVYTITPSSSNGCLGAPSTVVVTVNKQDNPTFNYASSTYCQTEPNPTPAITGLAGGTFTSVPAGLVFVNANSGEINLLATTVGTYTITYTTNGPCPATSTASVTVVTQPIATFSYVPVPVCQYSTNIAPTFVSGGSAGVFTSSPAGLVFVNPATGVIDLSLSTPGIYTVKNTIVPGACPGAIDSTTVNIKTAPIATATPSSQSLCSGSTTAINLTSSIPGTTFAWTVNATDVSGASNNSGASIAQALSTTTNSPGNVVYTITPTAPDGCNGQEITVTITVNPIPVATVAPPLDTICSGSVASLTLTSNVVGTFFSWTVVETGVSGGSNGSGLTIAQTLTTTNPTPGNAVYTITPSANGCSGTPVVATVNVNPVPVATATPSVPTICSGDTTAIALTADVSGTTFVWTFSQTNVTGASDGAGASINQSLTATSNIPGIVVYTITPTANGCSGTPIVATVTVNPRPVAIATPPSESLCSFGTTSIALTSNVFGTTFSWTVAESGVTGGSASSGFNIYQTLSTTANTSGTAIYTITPLAAGCTGTPINDTVTVYPIPVVTATPTSQTFCSGGATNIALSSTVAGTSFAWTVVQTGVTGASIGSDSIIVDTLTTTGIVDGTAAYTIIPTAGGGCSGSPISVTITVKPKPVVTPVPSPLSVCSGDTASVFLISNIPGTSFVWSISQTAASGAFASSGNTISQQLTSTTNAPGTVLYIVTPTFNSCAGDIDTIDVTVNPIPVVTATPSAPNICSLDTALIALSSNVAGTNFSWLVNQNNVSGGIAGAGDTIAQVLTNTNFLNLPGTAIYTITPTANGCSGAPLNVTVTVKRTDNAAYSYTSGTYCQTAPNPTPTITGLPGGIFSATPAGLVIDSLTGTINNLASLVNTYTLSYTTNGPCPKVNSMLMTITLAPGAVFSYPNTAYCQHGTNPVPVFATGASAGIFTAVPSGLVFVHVNTGEIDLSLSAPGTYTVTNTIPPGGTCAAEIASYTVTVDSAPTVTASSLTQTLCSGDTTSFNLTSTMPGTTYTWTVVQNGVSGGSDGNGTTINQVLATTSNSPGTAVYIITPNAGGCDGVPINITVIVNPIPAATAIPSAQVICSGTAPIVVLSSTVSGTVFNWIASQSGVTGAVNGSGLFINDILTATGTTAGTVVYTITPVAGGCAGDTVSVTVTVNPNAVATATPATQTICSGDSTAIALSSNIVGTSFTWSVSQSGVTGGSDGADSVITQLLTSTFGSTPGTATYYITPTANGCPGTPTTAVVTINPRPVVTINPSAQTVCSGDATSISLTSNMSGTSFVWTVSQNGVLGAANGTGANIVQTLTATGSTPGTVVYTIAPTANGCVGDSKTITVTVNPRPVISATPSSQTICSGSTTNIALSSDVVGTNFSWTVSQNNVTGGTAGSGVSIAQTLSASTAGTALYIVNPLAGGCSGSPISVSVTVQPSLIATALPSNKTICSGSDVSILLSSNIVGTSFAWTASQSGVTGASGGAGDTIAHTLTTLGPNVGTVVYTVISSAGTCVGTPITVNITVNPLPDITATPPAQSFCSGSTSSVALSSNVAGTTFAWTAVENDVDGATAGTGISIVQTLTTTTNSPGTAVYTITPSANGCEGTPINVTVTVNLLDDASFFYPSATFCQDGADPLPTITGLPGGVFASTTPPFSLIIDTLTGAIDLSGSALGIYTVSYTTTGSCPNTNSLNVFIRNTAPSADFSYLGSPYCQYGDNPTPIYGAGASAGIYTATPAGLEFVHVNTGEIDLMESLPGTYTITNTIPVSGSCAGATDTYVITIDPAPQVTATPPMQAICAGSSTSIVLSSNMPGTTYAWTVVDNGVSGTSSSTGDSILQVLYTTGLTTGTAVYTIVPTSGNCPGLPLDVSVTVDPCPIATAIPSTQAICSGNATSISLTSNIVGTVFSWTATENGATGASAGTGDAIVQTLSTTGDSVGIVTYLVTLTANGCDGIPIPVTVTVNPEPVITATPIAQTVCTGDSAFIVLTSNVPGTQFSWTASQLGVTGAADGNGDTIIHILSASGNVPGTVTYTITPTAEGSCPGQPVTATITVNPAPILTATPTTQVFCSGETSAVLLNSNISGSIFSWTVAQTNVSGATNDTASSIIQTLTATDSIQGSAVYTVIATDTVTGCSGTPVDVNILVNPLPVITASPASQIICTGSTTGINLTSNVAGTSFTWTVVQNGVTGAVPGSGASIAQTLAVAGTTSGTAVYSITPVGGSCVGDTIQVTITVNLMDSAQFAYPQLVYCQTGSDPTAVIAGLPGGTFSSSTGLVVLDTLTGLIDLSASPIGLHTVKYVTSGSCADSSIAYVTITSAPGAIFSYPDTSFCQSGPNPIAVIDSGSIAGIFSASPVGLVFANVNTGEIDLDSSAVGTYVITNTLLSSGCAPDSASFTISIVPLMAMATPSSQTICSGGTTSISLSSNISGTSYAWSVLQTGVTGAASGSDSVINQTLTLLGSTSGSAVYTIIPSTPTCIGDTLLVTVNIDAPPIGTLSPSSQTICSGATALINLSSNIPGTIYSWIASQSGVTGASAGIDTLISQTLSITGTDTGMVIYTIIPSSNGCNGSPITATVSVSPSDDASFVYSSATYCQSGNDPTPSITGVLGGTFTSSPPGLVIDSVSGAIDLSTSTLGVYVVEYTTNSVNCPSSSSITMTIGSTTPSAVFSYSSTTYCQNATNPLPIFPSGASAGIFSASPSGLVFAHVNTGEIDLASSNPGTYVITNYIPASGSCLSATYTTAIVITAADDASFVYTSATYCTSGNDPVPSITGLQGGLFTVSPLGLVIDSITGTIALSQSNLGVYTLSYTTSGSCPATSSIVMTITDTTPSTGFSYPYSPYCQNGSNPVPIYDSLASAGIYSATPPGLAFVHLNTGEIDLSASTPGTYTVTNSIPQSGSCLASVSTTTVVIGSPDDANFVYSSATYCQFGVNPTPSILGISGGVFSSIPSGLIINDSTGTINLTQSQLGTYTVTYSTNSNCPNAFSITMTITDTTPVASFTYPGSPFCEGGYNPTPTFSSGGSAGIFSASPSGLVFVNQNTGEINLSLSTPGTYTVTNLIPPSGSCLSDTATTTVEITPQQDASFEYSSATYCEFGTNPTPTITGVLGGTFTAMPVGLAIDPSTGTIDLATSTLGTYTLSYTLTGTCAGSSSITMTITDTTPTTTFSYSTTSFCQSGINPYVVFNSGSSAGTFSAAPAGLVFEHINTGEIDIANSAAGTYIVTNTIPASGSCLASTSTSIITINGAPVITATPSSQTICTGGTTSIVLSSSMGATSYNWVANDAGVAGASSGSGAGTSIAQTLTTTTISQGTVTYIVTPDVNGCVGDTIVVAVTVVPLPSVNMLTAVVTDANCADSAGSVLGLTVPPGQNELTFVWTNAQLDTVSIGTSDLTNATPGAYTLTITNANGCTNTVGPFLVNSTSAVVSAFTVDNMTGQTPLTIDLTNESTSATSYMWLFGGIDTSMLAEDTYTIIPSGDFEICLVAYNSYMCTDTMCKTIFVEQNSEFIVPNVFTPNGDGVNDIFTIKGAALKSINAEIFNRWGQKEYEWSTTNGGWDGRTASGLAASDGTYYYIIKAEGKDGKEYFEKGSFTLIREGK